MKRNIYHTMVGKMLRFDFTTECFRVGYINKRNRQK